MIAFSNVKFEKVVIFHSLLYTQVSVTHLKRSRVWERGRRGRAVGRAA